MTSHQIFRIILSLSVLLSILESQTVSKSEVLFEKAKYIMETTGDLERAIKIFEKITKKYPKDREMAAKSLLYIGLCYEKMGINKAKSYYTKVIDNYHEQTETVNLAKEKLEILNKFQKLVEKTEKEFTMTKFHTEKKRKGVLSPDGKKLALIDNTDTGNVIWLKDIGSGKEVYLTSDPSLILELFWSPDCKKIAYVNLAWNVSVVSIKEGASKTVIRADPELEKTDHIIWPTGWTLDSKKLIFQETTKGLFAIPASGGEWEEIFAFSDLEEAKKRRLETMVLSPDGRFIAYDSKINDSKDIYIMPVGREESFRITRNPADDSRPFWSFDGKWLAFLSTRTGQSEIWVAKITSAGKPGGEPIQVTRGGAKGGVWTREGRIAYVTREGIEHVFAANLDASEEIQLTKSKGGYRPRWSPDSEKIVYTASHGENRQRAIWIVSSKGGERKFVTVGGFPCWSPDGKKIAFNAQARTHPSKSVISVIPAEGGVAKDLMVYDGYLRNLDWSPDGKHIAFSYSREKDVKNPIPDSRIEIEDIYIIPVDDGEPIRLTQMDKKGFIFSSPRWSPDGKKIAFRSLDYESFAKEGKSGPIEIWEIGVEDGKTELITNRLEGWDLSWSPNSEYIISSKHQEGSEETWITDHRLYKVSAEGEEPEELNIMGRMADISPDGKKVVFTRAIEHDIEFWLVENFLPSEKMAGSRQ